MSLTPAGTLEMLKLAVHIVSISVALQTLGTTHPQHPAAASAAVVHDFTHYNGDLYFSLPHHPISVSLLSFTASLLFHTLLSHPA